MIAAFHDTRFNPIDESELQHLRCDISLLTQFETLPQGSIYDWTIGRHGIQIDFSDPIRPGKSYSATFLPEVAKEQGWTQQETIQELVHKSGYRGEITPQLKSTIRITRYQSEKESLTYAAYVALRESILQSTSSKKKSTPTRAAVDQSGEAIDEDAHNSDDDDDDDDGVDSNELDWNKKNSKMKQSETSRPNVPVMMNGKVRSK